MIDYTIKFPIFNRKMLEFSKFNVLGYSLPEIDNAIIQPKI